MQALTETSWPGNVRELQHYIERAVVTTTGPALECARSCDAGSVVGDEDFRSATRGAVTQTERVAHRRRPQEDRWKSIKAAKLLKISRASLYNKLRTYQIH